MVRRAQSEAIREDLEQAGVGGLRVLDHRCVRLQRDVNGRDRVLKALRARRLRRAELRCQADAECGQDLHVSMQHTVLLLLARTGSPRRLLDCSSRRRRP